MASDKKAQSEPIKHAVLGPADAILDDRTRTVGTLLFGLMCIALGPLGVWFGSGDLAHGSYIFGYAYVGGGVVLFLYGFRSVLDALGRLRSRVALVVGRDGFEVPGGQGPVGWDEVATVSDPASPPGDPRMLRVQLVDPADYVARHHLGGFQRYVLRARKNDLFLGRDMAMPVADIQALMRKRLAEFGRGKHDGADEAAPVEVPEAARPQPSRKARKGR